MNTSGWLEPANEAAGRPVWARKGIAAATCPVSYISPVSLAWIEEFIAWKVMGGGDLRQLPARTVEAICLLENEAAKEANNGER